MCVIDLNVNGPSANPTPVTGGGGGCCGFTTVPVTKTIRLSEWVTPGDTAIPGMTRVSRTETFNTQVHWPNLQRRYRAQPSVRN